MTIANTYDTADRDYSTISPSARALLLMKGHTTIPYAREAAALLPAAEAFGTHLSDKDFKFWARVVHFENRYRCINQLLWDEPVHHILELCSGFSFRGLDAMQKKNIHYIDTDLPGVINLKKDFITALQQQAPAEGSQLDILPLNALDALQVNATAERFSPGPVTIVNEGLLMYLDLQEKEHLCSIIHTLLSHRGGYWITADIYIKDKHAGVSKQLNDQLNSFFEEHRITEKMFNSFEDAELFFNNAGFVIDKEARPDKSALSALPALLQHATEGQLHKLQKAGKLQTTWRLKIAK